MPQTLYYLSAFLIDEYHLHIFCNLNLYANLNEINMIVHNYISKQERE